MTKIRKFPDLTTKLAYGDVGRIAIATGYSRTYTQEVLKGYHENATITKAAEILINARREIRKLRKQEVA